jgi:hypothetical protein
MTEQMHKSQMGYVRPRIVKGPVSSLAKAIHSPRRRAAGKRARAKAAAEREQRKLSRLLGGDMLRGMAKAILGKE